MAIQVHEKRQQRQLQGATRWVKAKDLELSHANGWGTLWYATGVGKTYTSYLIANKMLERNTSHTFIVSAPSPTLIKQWQDSLKSYIDPKYHPNFRFYTSTELLEIRARGERIEASLWIIDELHEWYSEERIKLFDGMTIGTKYALGLTATYTDIKGRHKQIEALLPVVDRIDSEEAIREGFISKYVEFNLGVLFTTEEQIQYDNLTKIITRNLAFFGKGGLDLVSKVLQGDKKSNSKGFAIANAVAAANGWRQGLNLSNPKEFEIDNLWNPKKVMGYARLAMDNIRERKTLIYHAMNKLRAARDIVVKYDTLKTICFSQSTRFADALASTINKHYAEGDNPPPKVCLVFHSALETIVEANEKGKLVKKGKTRLKKEILELFRAAKGMLHRVLSTASSLDRGLDVRDIRLCVTTSGTQNPTQYDQRKGRGLRLEDDNEDVVVLIINIYVRNTQDEKWLRGRQSKSNSVVYWVDSVDDINYTPRSAEVFNLNEI